MELSGIRDGAKKSVTVPEIPGQLGPMQKTFPYLLNDPCGIHVHQNYVFVCDIKDHRVRVLGLELNPYFDIPYIHEPMDITHFKGLYFVTS